MTEVERPAALYLMRKGLITQAEAGRSTGLTFKGSHAGYPPGQGPTRGPPEPARASAAVRSISVR
jgi:hypothetical protein